MSAGMMKLATKLAIKYGPQIAANPVVAAVATQAAPFVIGAVVVAAVIDAVTD